MGRVVHFWPPILSPLRKGEGGPHEWLREQVSISQTPPIAFSHMERTKIVELSGTINSNGSIGGPSHVLKALYRKSTSPIRYQRSVERENTADLA